MASSVPSFPFCDPHFHFWDHTTRPNDNLGGIVKTVPTYLPSHFTKDAAGVRSLTPGSTDATGPARLAAAVHVETVVGQVPGGFHIDTVDETSWVTSLIPATGIPINIVAFVDLSREDAMDVWAAHAKAAETAHAAYTAAGGTAPAPRVVGVRMIMNYHPTDASLTWPQVPHGRYLTGSEPTFTRNLRALSAAGAVFDLHANWFQLRDAAKLLADIPDLVVVINHLGCPKLSGAPEDAARDAEVEAEWDAGMSALAAHTHTHIKISGLTYVRAGWEDAASPARAVISRMVRRVLELFGPSRAMVASNFPVDGFLSGVSLHAQYHAVADVLAFLPQEDLRKVFHDTACAVYKLPM